MKIGPYSFPGKVGLAPMAGVTDRPFRQLCRRLGAAWAPTEMVSSDRRLWNTEKTRRRMDHTGEGNPVIVQIAGGDPRMIADAAKHNVDRGADIIDINMGCPAKKVCRKAAGSALLQDEALVGRILDAAVAAVDVPVTLKTRTGWAPDRRNGVRIARIAQAAGIQAIAVHGRTRACMYRGEAEYDTIRAVRDSVSIPVIANGDIDSPAKARRVLDYTGADGILVGRAAQGRPWVFSEINHYLEFGRTLAPPSRDTVQSILLDHLRCLYAFYGEHTGVRVARKHLGWYCADRADASGFRRQVMGVESADEQLRLTESYFSGEQRSTAPREVLAA